MPSNAFDAQHMQVLDLSKRRDSIETRKTPSPYNTNSSRESTSPHTSTEQTSSQPIIHQTLCSPGSSSGYQANRFNSSPYSIDYSATHPQHLQCYFPHASQAASHLQQSFSFLRDRQYIAEPLVKSEHHFDNVNQVQPYQRHSSTQSPPPRTASRTSDFDEKFQGKLTSDETRITPLPPLIYPKLANREGKVSRPFKAYPRDPLAMAATFTATDALLDVQKAEKYSAFRKRMLEQIHASNGGRPTVTNPKMRRNGASTCNAQDEQANDSSSGNEDHSTSGTESCNLADSKDKSCGNNNNSNAVNQNGTVKDAAYYERRKKNNAAAKKSRDRRRIKEDEIAVRAAFLEHENIELRIELAALKNQLAMVAANSNR